MSRFKLTMIWIMAFVLLIVPLHTRVHYQQRISVLEEEVSWLKTRFLDCVDADNPQRLYLSSHSSDWVEFKCVTLKDNTIPNKRKQGSGGGIGRRTGAR